MRARSILCFSAAAAVFASAAHAEWNGTQFGMSPSQVLAVAHGKAVSNKESRTKYGLMTDIQVRQMVAGAPAVVSYHFESRKLTAIEGRSAGKDCPRIEAGFRSKYSKPSEANAAGEPYRREWAVGGDELTLQIDGAACKFDITDESNE